MAGGRSLKPFYITLGLVAAVGVVLIARSMGQPGGSASPSTPFPTPIAVAAGARGVVLGSESAPVEIAEYSDFQCPFCARFAVLQMPDIRDRLVANGRLRWRFMHFPLEGHANTRPAHLAAACAREQGRFWEMHDAIYQGQGDWAESRRPAGFFRDYAERLGLNPDQFRSCVETERAMPEVEADRLRGDSLGVNSTPTFFVNGRHLPEVPTYDQIKAIVDSIAPVAPAGAATPNAGTPHR
ncbi:MAG: DsbA family protein [Gemmatimonadetes bacterium]|nr:DsbA family protein [Gemmatimonadota bacterium]